MADSAALGSARQRSALEERLGKTTGFRSSQQLHAMLREEGEAVSLATVYRLLQSMAHEGELDVLRSQDSENRYRRCHRQEHHHHLVCRRCGHTVEVAETVVERWADRISRKHGFTAVSHTVELPGICAACENPPTAAGGGKNHARPRPPIPG